METEITFIAACSALPFGADNAVPEWVMLLPAGVSQGVDGRGPYNNDQPDAVVANSMEDGRPLPFDYNHQTIFAALNGQESPAAGWINKLENREGAIWGQVEWTARGNASVASRDYRFVSPAFKHDKSGRVSVMVSAGLVNSPNLRELPAINARLGVHASRETGDPKIMDEAQRAAFAAAFGLPATSTAEQLVAHAQANRQLATGAPDPAQFVPMAAFVELQQQVSGLRETAVSAHVAGLVDSATREGKLTPAMREWGIAYATKDAAAFEEWAAVSPAIVPPGTDPKIPKDDVSTHASGLNTQELEVCTNMGLTPEAYAKSKVA